MAFRVPVGRFVPPIWRDERPHVTLGVATIAAALNIAACITLFNTAPDEGFRRGRGALDPVAVTMVPPTGIGIRSSERQDEANDDELA